MRKRASQPLLGVGRHGDPGDETVVLVVDDDPHLRELIARTLQDGGYAYRLAADAAAARKHLRARPAPSVCLLDIHLDESSGLDFARELSSLAPDVAVVMMSGVDELAVAEQALSLGAFDYLVKPFRLSELLIAVATALHRRRLEQESRELHRKLETAVELRTLELALSREETIQRLARAVEFRDTPTGQHVERMSAYCRMLASKLGCSPDRAALIRTASLLHDIGKLGIPDRILSKPGKLTGEEWGEMQTHTTLGHQLLSGSSSELVELAATIALTHHERVDGDGYPRGLGDGEIPLEGRIAAVCDVFDALTSARPYRRRAYTLQEALAIMRAERGRAFDPEIFDTFVDSLDEVKRIRARYEDAGAVNGWAA
jgi:putative two-component system response regulator